jgi:methylphosphotriester-DNA--protein-cysteine methyltransferase
VLLICCPSLGHAFRLFAARSAVSEGLNSGLDQDLAQSGAGRGTSSYGMTAGLSRAAFSRRFTALIGRPPLTYLTWWRMTTAARLLRESDAPLGEVSTRIGYTSEFAFANAFKREYGTAPGKYRRQNRVETENSELDGMAPQPVVTSPVRSAER